jgi:hypothetical protein
MNAAVAAFTERRDETRVAGQTLGHMRAPKAIFAPEGEVSIQEVSATGLRLRADVQLHPDEELVLQLRQDPQPIHATVVWVKEVPPGRFRTTKSWIAGCRLAPESMARIHLGSELDGKTAFDRKVLWMIAAMLGTAAVTAYLLLRFATLVGNAGGMP